MEVLKGIPKIIPPKVMEMLMEMGHGDELAIVDANFPAHSMGVPVIRADGTRSDEMLQAVLKFLPLDTYTDYNTFLMDNGKEEKPEVWKSYEEILKNSGEDYRIKALERFEFYERVRKAYFIVATGETRLYANIILKKGVVT